MKILMWHPREHQHVDVSGFQNRGCECYNLIFRKPGGYVDVPPPLTASNGLVSNGVTSSLSSVIFVGMGTH